MSYPIYILAEGKSSRMGTDKGLVKINGTEMVLHCINNLKPLEQPITIITSNPDYQKFGYRMIADKIKNRGPSQGVITALEDLDGQAGCQAEAGVIVSCDMPLVNDLMIRQFDGAIIDSEIVCYEKDFLFPFPGIYSKDILEKWKAAVESGNLKMQSLIKQFDFKTLPIEQADLFLNVNTPEDVLKVEEKLR